MEWHAIINWNDRQSWRRIRIRQRILQYKAIKVIYEYI